MVNSKGVEVEVTEKIRALTTEELVNKTKQVYKRIYTKDQIRDNYIYPLMNQGYIDKTDSQIDKRAKIYYPVSLIEDPLKIQNCKIITDRAIYFNNQKYMLKILNCILANNT
jgi:hypothetical protein